MESARRKSDTCFWNYMKRAILWAQKLHDFIIKWLRKSCLKLSTPPIKLGKNQEKKFEWKSEKDLFWDSLYFSVSAVSAVSVSLSYLSAPFSTNFLHELEKYRESQNKSFSDFRSNFFLLIFSYFRGGVDNFKRDFLIYFLMKSRSFCAHKKALFM